MERDSTVSATRDFIIEGLSDAVITVDPQGCILDLNRAARSLIGRADSKLLGQPIEQAWPEWSSQKICQLDGAEAHSQVVLGHKDERRVYDLLISKMLGARGRLVSQVITLKDVTDRTRAEAEFHQRNRELLSLQSATAAIVSSLDLQFVLDTVTWEMVSLLRVEGCAIFEWCQEADTITMIARYSSTGQGEEKPLARVHKLEDHPIKRRVLVERCSQQMSISQPDIDAAELAYMQSTNVKSLMLLPMIFQDRVVGLVEISEGRVERAFTDHEISLLHLLASQTASAVENAQLYERAQQVILERMQAEKQVKASLKEKEVLLNEIHHRVKNNLQVISSLLSLQMQHIEDQAVLEMFQDSLNRIRSMALIHEKLYRSQDLANVGFGEYIRNLAGYLIRSYQAHAAPVALKVSADDVFLSIDTAIPCGLIINELVSNTLKHAFPATDGAVPERPDGTENEIRIEVCSTPDSRFTLIVADNGIGFPPGLDFRQTESLGLQLVNSLVTQLKGTVELNNNCGTEFRITFVAAENGGP